MNVNKLKCLMGENDHTRKFIAKRLGITPSGLQKKLNGKSEFKASEIKILADLYKVSVDYFFN